MDTHSHGVPLGLLRDLRAGRKVVAGVDVLHSSSGFSLTFAHSLDPVPPVLAGLLDFSERLEWLDARGIRRQFISPWLDVQGSTLGATAGAVWVRLLNDSLAEEMRDSGGRLRGLATVHLGSVDGAISEMARATSELDFSGVILSTHPLPAELVSPDLDAFWEAAAELGCPIVLHPDVCGPGAAAFDNIGLLNAVGRTIDTTLVATQLVAQGVLRRHPSLRFVLVHGGGFFPYQSSRLARALDIESLPGGPALHGDALREALPSFYYDTVLMSPSSLANLARHCGCAHILMGSDYPFSIGDPDPIGTVVNAFEGPSDQAAILEGNALALYL